jgi:hypothetical protein
MTKNPDDTRTKVDSLRAQAVRCRRLAGATTDREVAQKLAELAGEFEQRALELEAGKHCG